MNRRPTWIATVTAAVVLVACGLAWWLLRSDTGSGPAPDASPSAAASRSAEAAPTIGPEPGLCDREVEEPFTPHRIAIEGVVDRAEVVGVARDDRGVTGVLPISNKADVAWDLGGIRPGSHRGNVLLNTHTWPDGSALGNALLDRLREGDRIVLRGSNGVRQCYEVTREIEVLARAGYPPYYRTDGPHQVAIIVCSGTRSAAGEWSHRTIWFARPVRT
ncbi:class F sortase [Nocardioides bizhenqiangii]|uniref:Class F sortase n=1 Tax=Nocardioides bizhenqiangii TaxID=3095076 RepID=A0ABZ0ZY53_9ACTN|nr:MULTISPECIES: class F sortase [unclassified Nocardioides]MDZ5622326.1 class F sortase [Nocardioides sp. HM23]WQQ28502.1 class F sortase [Nocardioides sp. HM61]